MKYEAYAALSATNPIPEAPPTLLDYAEMDWLEEIALSLIELNKTLMVMNPRVVLAMIARLRTAGLRQETPRGSRRDLVETLSEIDQGIAEVEATIAGWDDLSNVR